LGIFCFAAAGAVEEVAEGGEWDEAADAADADAAPAVESAAWARVAQQFSAATDAAAAMGLVDAELAKCRDFFLGYGRYLLQTLPQEALEQAGLLAGDAGADAVAAAGEGPSAEASAQQQQREAGQQGQEGEDDEEDQEELYAEFGNLELKNDLAAGLFGSLGFDMDSLMACCAEV
jgi:hypothetical protein